MADDKKNEDQKTETSDANQENSADLLKKLQEATDAKGNVAQNSVEKENSESSLEENTVLQVQKKNDEQSGQEKEDNSDSINFLLLIKIFLIAFAIALIIITAGYFKKRREKRLKLIKSLSDAIDDKRKRLVETENKIAALELKKEQIKKEEKIYIVTARIIIALLLAGINIWFANNYIYFNGTFELNKILNFNSAILLCYSFIAFILYGTPANFVSTLKSKISDYLSKKHIDTLTELNILLKEREELVKEIEIFERRKASLKI